MGRYLGAINWCYGAVSSDFKAPLGGVYKWSFYIYKTTELQTFQSKLKKVIYQVESWTEVRANFETTNFAISLLCLYEYF